MRKGLIVAVIAAIAISLGLLAFYSYYTINRKDTIASVNQPMNNSIANNAKMVPPSDEVTLQVLHNDTSNQKRGYYLLPVHVTHKLDLHDAKNGYIAIFPILPMWNYGSPNDQEKEYFSLQDENRRSLSVHTFFHREGAYAPTVTCKPAENNGSTPKQIEASIAEPMFIPVQNLIVAGVDHRVLYANYNTFGISPIGTVSHLSAAEASGGSTSNTDSKMVLMRYNLTFSSFNNAKIELPDDAIEKSRTHWSCVTSADNPVFTSWHVNIYNVVFEVRQKTI